MVAVNHSIDSSSAITLTVLITGANGTQGYALCQALTAIANDSGHSLRIRAMVRDASSIRSQRLLQIPHRNGAQTRVSIVLTQADLTDSASLTRAFAPNSDGTTVDAVYLNTTPTFSDAQEEVRIAQSLLVAAADTGSVRHIVYSSVVGLANPELQNRIGRLPDWAEEAGAQLRPADELGVERVLFRAKALSSEENKVSTDSAGRRMLQGYFGAKAQIEYLTRKWATEGGGAKIRTWTILRPGWFMSNFLPPTLVNYWPEMSQKSPVLRSAISPKARMMLVAPDDLGAVAARAILGFINRDVNFVSKTINVGSQAISLKDAAQILSENAGNSVRISAEYVRDSEAADEIRAGNVQRDVQAWNAEMQDCFEPSGLEKFSRS